MHAIPLQQAGLFHSAQKVWAKDAFQVFLSDLVDDGVVVQIRLWWRKYLVTNRG